MRQRITLWAAGAALLLAATAGPAMADGYVDYGGSSYSEADGTYQDDSYPRHASDDPTCHHNKRYRYRYSSNGGYRAEDDGDYDYNYTSGGSESHGYGQSDSLKDAPRTGQCLSRRQIERTLARQGWRDLYGIQVAPDLVGVTASRPNGLTYRLKIDKCSGVIVAANLLDQENGSYGATTSSYDQPQY